MDAQELQFGLNTLLSILFGAGGAMAVWFTLKGQVSLIKQKVEAQDGDIQTIHIRIDNLKSDLKQHKESSDNVIREIRADIQAMELRIIKEIHKIVK